MNDLNLIVKMKFGSHVYGTNLPTSDTDIKGVYLPKADDILLQRVKNNYQEHTKKDPHGKNKADDIDMEIFSLQQFLYLLTEGQSVALGMLFTPEEYILEKTPHWDLICNMRGRFIHCGVSSFVGYCRTQANKYGIKGSRMRAVKESIDFLMSKVPEDNMRLKLKDVVTEAELQEFAKKYEHVNIVPLINKGTQQLINYFEVVNRKFEPGVHIGEIITRLEKIWNEYGKRAKLAMENEDIDWKALMHAVRVQEEAKELLATGFITYPRPERELLLKIRKGEMDYKEVARIIEDGLDDLERIQKESLLPETPDEAYADQLVIKCYRRIVCEELG